MTTWRLLSKIFSCRRIYHFNTPLFYKAAGLSVLPTAMWKKGKSQIATMDGWINWHDDDATVAGLCAVVILIVVAIVLYFTYQQYTFFSLPSIFGLSVMLF